MIDETVREIEELQTQSSSVVAAKAAEALADLFDRDHPTAEEFLLDLQRSSDALRRANHSHAPLYTSQDRIVSAVSEPEPETVAEGKDRLEDAIQAVVADIQSNKAAAAARAAELVRDGDTVLTHENSSTVMATFDRAVDAGTTFSVYATESRPRLLGRRTVRQLAEREGCDATLVVDSAAGHFLADCDRVLLGMNCLVSDVMYNRIGTYQIVTAADAQDVPVTVVAASAKFVGGGFEFENTERPHAEVMREPADGFAVANPGYDATPTHYLDSVVTENGLIEF